LQSGQRERSHLQEETAELRSELAEARASAAAAEVAVAAELRSAKKKHEAAVQVIPLLCLPLHHSST
jgi:predicted  nucleic acid-binding Zn-ribbon protein